MDKEKLQQRIDMLKTNTVKELRLLVCGWCMHTALWFAPKEDVEGLIVVSAVRQWISESVRELEKILKLKRNRYEQRRDYCKNRDVKETK